MFSDIDFDLLALNPGCIQQVQILIQSTSRFSGGYFMWRSSKLKTVYLIIFCTVFKLGIVLFTTRSLGQISKYACHIPKCIIIWLYSNLFFFFLNDISNNAYRRLKPKYNVKSSPKLRRMYNILVIVKRLILHFLVIKSISRLWELYQKFWKAVNHMFFVFFYFKKFF